MASYSGAGNFYAPESFYSLQENLRSVYEPIVNDKFVNIFNFTDTNSNHLFLKIIPKLNGPVCLLPVVIHVGGDEIPCMLCAFNLLANL